MLSDGRFAGELVGVRKTNDSDALNELDGAWFFLKELSGSTQLYGLIEFPQAGWLIDPRKQTTSAVEPIKIEWLERIDSPNGGGMPGATKVSTWPEFVQSCLQETVGSRFLYRGLRRRTYSLVSTMHREGRYNLHRYANETLPEVGRRFSALTQRPYPTDTEGLKHLMCLARHNGFPTPLLDWTESPFIAAFFAFDRVSKAESDTHVRIVRIDCAPAAGDDPVGRDIPDLCSPFPFIHFFKPTLYENARAANQLSFFSITNVCDMTYPFLGDKETLVSQLQGSISSVQLPIADRETALRDLRKMGINPASMYADLGGICRDVWETPGIGHPG